MGASFYIDISPVLAILDEFRSLSAPILASFLSNESLPALEHLNANSLGHSCAAPECPWARTRCTEFFCGDPRLGPTTLPTTIPLSCVVAPYDRLGGARCPGRFLERWFDSGKGTYIYPPSHGFQFSLHGDPIAGQQTLFPGMLVDRFGSENGVYLSPASTPFTQRSLPPKNLNKDPEDPTLPYNYRVYEVEKPFSVLSGPIASWFGQPGQGTQYQTQRSIGDLVDAGFLSRIDLKRNSVQARMRGGILM